MNRIKLICAIGLILSMIGLSIINLVNGDWKTFTLGVLYSIANLIIFVT